MLAYPTNQLDDCRARRAAHEETFEHLFHDFDFLLAPSAPGGAPKGHARTGDPRMSLLFSHARLPTLSLPAILNDEGMPMAVQLVAAKGEDQLLLGMGEVLESLLEFDARPKHSLWANHQPR